MTFLLGLAKDSKWQPYIPQIPLAPRDLLNHMILGTRMLVPQLTSVAKPHSKLHASESTVN